MRRRIGILTGVLIAALVLVVGLAAAISPKGPHQAGAASPDLPHTMASVGDSVTRAFNVSSDALLTDAPDESWSTGSDPLVASEYSRLLEADPSLAGHVFNDAESGARMSALAGQLETAAGQRADYVTVLMGANDACAASVSAMTPAETFRQQFDEALASFTRARPGASISVSSIPNLFQLWSVLHENSRAQAAWALLGTCQALLAPTATPAEREQVLDQVVAYNDALADVCASYLACHWDGGAVFEIPFTAAQVSTIDYFHPSISGQTVLAATAWKASPFAD